MTRIAHCLVALAAFAATACDASDDALDRPEVVVFAASSLTEAFQDIERTFEASHDVDVKLTFAGSQVLRLQLEQGAAADVFASANAAHMQALVDDGIVTESRVFADNELAVIVPASDAASIESFTDLQWATRIVVGNPNVPVGVYTRRMFARAELELGPEFLTEVRAHVVSEESNVRLVRAKVELAEADAAIVYRTDASSSERVRVIAIPEPINVRVSYPMGRLAGSANSDAAEQFIDFVHSSRGQELLRSHGFVTPTP